LLPDAGGKIAGPSVRNQGTIGGSIANADPAGNFPTTLKALGGTVMLRSSEDTREIDAEDFFIDDGITVCESNEIIQSISVPREPFPVGRTGMAFVRLKRAAQKWPIVSAATAIRVDNPNVESPLIEEARIAIANASSIPLRASKAENLLEGVRLTHDRIQEVINSVTDKTDPNEDIHVDSTYRTEVAGEYVRRSLEQSYARAGSADEIPWTEH
jgi:carbon-monoxide dehydrogenase medium subunit